MGGWETSPASSSLAMFTALCILSLWAAMMRKLLWFRER
jgi:hypothetical protein